MIKEVTVKRIDFVLVRVFLVTSIFAHTNQVINMINKSKSEFKIMFVNLIGCHIEFIMNMT